MGSPPSGSLTGVAYGFDAEAGLWFCTFNEVLKPNAALDPANWDIYTSGSHLQFTAAFTQGFAVYLAGAHVVGPAFFNRCDYSPPPWDVMNLDQIPAAAFQLSP